ncbi:MAG TPA: hypothetical protein VES01_04970 [Dermatophilaceae bacterium]|nr:hypothetical protein [Dermatophilaceae bacterium]
MTGRAESGSAGGGWLPRSTSPQATYTSTYDDPGSLQQVLDMGMEAGSTQVINQIDAFFAGTA